MSTTLPPDLRHWLEHTTGDLPDDLREAVCDEIITHYWFALDDALRAGKTSEQAHLAAMIALGDPSASRRMMQMTYRATHRYLRAAMVALVTPLIYGLVWVGDSALDGWWLFTSDLVIMVTLVVMLIHLKVMMSNLFSFEDITREARWTTIAYVCSALFTAFWLILLNRYGTFGMNRATVRVLWIITLSGQVAIGGTSIWLGLRTLRLRKRLSAAVALASGHILVGSLFIIGAGINLFFRNFTLYRQLEIATEGIFMLVFAFWAVVFMQALRQSKFSFS
ncbi:MAG: hypothetical protein RLP44_32565 [Aggregatilineales bacterium]